VYLASIPEAIFDVVVSGTAYDHVLLARGGANSLTFQIVRDELDERVEHSILADATLESTVKKQVIQARRGQGKFRSNVEALEKSCRLTGITNSSLLKASHIRPWRSCASATQRLDGMNGLMLTPDADLLFDRGFITFGDEGDVEVSPRFDQEDLRRLGLGDLAWKQLGFSEASAPWKSKAFTNAQCDYLAYHRTEVFVGAEGITPAQ
jgi:putative restriction endonuclease